MCVYGMRGVGRQPDAGHRLKRESASELLAASVVGVTVRDQPDGDTDRRRKIAVGVTHWRCFLLFGRSAEGGRVAVI